MLVTAYYLDEEHSYRKQLRRYGRPRIVETKYSKKKQGPPQRPRETPSTKSADELLLFLHTTLQKSNQTSQAKNRNNRRPATGAKEFSTQSPTSHREPSRNPQSRSPPKVKSASAGTVNVGVSIRARKGRIMNRDAGIIDAVRRTETVVFFAAVATNELWADANGVVRRGSGA